MTKRSKTTKPLPCQKRLNLRISSNRILYPIGQDMKPIEAAHDAFERAKLTFVRYVSQNARSRHEDMLKRAEKQEREAYSTWRGAVCDRRYLEVVKKLSSPHFSPRATLTDIVALSWFADHVSELDPQLRDGYVDSCNLFFNGREEDLADFRVANHFRRFFHDMKARVRDHNPLTESELPRGIRLIPNLSFVEFVILSEESMNDDFEGFVSDLVKRDDVCDSDDLSRFEFPSSEVFDKWIERAKAEEEQAAAEHDRLVEICIKVRLKTERFGEQLIAMSSLQSEGNVHFGFGHTIPEVLSNCAILDFADWLPGRAAGKFTQGLTLSWHDVWFLYLNNVFRFWTGGSDEIPSTLKEFLLWHLSHPKWLHRKPGEDCPLPWNQWPEAFIDAWAPISWALIGYHPAETEKRFKKSVLESETVEELAFYFAAYLRQRFLDRTVKEQIGESRWARLCEWNVGWTELFIDNAAVYASSIEPIVAQFSWKTDEDIAWSALLEEEREEQERKAKEQEEWREKAREMALDSIPVEVDEPAEAPPPTYVCEYVFDVQNVDGRTEAFTFTEETLEETLESFCRDNRIINMVPFSSIANALIHFLQMDDRARLAMRKEKNADGVVWSKLKRDNQRIYLLPDSENLHLFKMHLMRRKDWAHLRG
jgi:hypothetical protein